MKLILTSQGFAENKKIFDEILILSGKKAENIRLTFFSIIQSDKDNYYVNLNIDLVNSLGISKENIKVVNICEKIPEGCFDDLDVVYMCGGNAYLILDSLRKNGFVAQIFDFINKGGVYFGHSAGSTIMGPNIDIAKCGDGDVNHISLKDIDGFNIISFGIWPHFEDKFEPELKRFKRRYAYKFIVLRDDQAISIDGNYMKLIY